MNISDRFKNNIVLIFGGTSGIGLMTAIDFIKNGAKHVIICGRSEWKWTRAKNIIQKNMNEYIVKEYDDKIEFKNSTIQYIQGDVRIEDSVKNVIKKTIKIHGYINVYFNNAGVQPIWGNTDGDITELNYDSNSTDGEIIYKIQSTERDKKFRNTCSTPTSDFCENPIATFVMGIIYCLKWELYYAFTQSSNVPVSIINMISRNGVNIPSYERPIYSACKAFIHSITQSAATQAARKSLKTNRSVRINGVAPGPILTPLEIPIYLKKSNVFDELDNQELSEFDIKASKGVPMGRSGKTNEISPTILFLADHNQSSYITGSIITIDGGYTASPVFE
uniref:Short-chain type dehydrogenase reductase family protein n=1 Tax=Borely moumouvirus TaxID=2712067 RepID=A0A6G6AB85_9VIRU